MEWIHNVFQVSMLRKYILDPSHIFELPPVEREEDLLIDVQPIGIVDQIIEELRNKVITMVKVLRRSDKVEKMTRETETSIKTHYLYLFTN